MFFECTSKKLLDVFEATIEAVSRFGVNFIFFSFLFRVLNYSLPYPSILASVHIVILLRLGFMGQDLGIFRPF